MTICILEPENIVKVEGGVLGDLKSVVQFRYSAGRKLIYCSYFSSETNNITQCSESEALNKQTEIDNRNKLC